MVPRQNSPAAARGYLFGERHPPTRSGSTKSARSYPCGRPTSRPRHAAPSALSPEADCAATTDAGLCTTVLKHCAWFASPQAHPRRLQHHQHRAPEEPCRPSWLLRQRPEIGTSPRAIGAWRAGPIGFRPVVHRSTTYTDHRFLPPPPARPAVASRRQLQHPRTTDLKTCPGSCHLLCKTSVSVAGACACSPHLRPPSRASFRTRHRHPTTDPSAAPGPEPTGRTPPGS
mmetsp:Transcript_2988/g.6882  ORF Transcript_2988/g.6882 Transcript_2988/m.6882 type:complete len:229 (+) Transcript_2988:1774-2460(+)